MGDDEWKAEMRALVIRAHAEQRRNGGRVPYAVHVMSVAEILADALSDSGEATDSGLARDLYLAALGHDLYEDTSVGPSEIRARFGTRVDVLIEAMTNRVGDHDPAQYEAQIRAAPEEVKLVKLADLVDNVTSCAYGIHDLGAEWIERTFLPLVAGTRAIVESFAFERYPQTAAALASALRFGMRRLEANLSSFKALA